jgi:hypothetical protein
MNDRAWTAVDFTWCVIGAGFTAISVWLTVRTINRRERWATQALAVTLILPVLYVVGFGPACWLASEEKMSAAVGRAVCRVYIGAERAQIAIARRGALPATVAAALAEVGSLAACISLAANRSAEVTETALLRLLERHGKDAELRETLLSRGDLPARLRERLMAMVSEALKSFVIERGWLSPERAERLAHDAERRGALSLACDERLGLVEVVTCLKEGGRLTPAFVVHALLLGELDLVAASLADLGNTPVAKVAAFLRENRAAPLRAVLKRAGIPNWLAPIFPMALTELRAAAIAAAGAAAATPLRVALRRILDRLGEESRNESAEETGRLIAYLRTLEAETARDEARTLAEAMITLDQELRELALPELASAANADARPELELEAYELEPFESAPVDLDAVAVARAA